MRWVVWCLAGLVFACGKLRPAPGDQRARDPGSGGTDEAATGGGAGRAADGGHSAGGMESPHGGSGSGGASTSAAGNGPAAAGSSGTAGAGAGAGTGSGGASGGQPASNGGALASAGASNDAGAAGSPEEECGEYLACGCGCCGGATPGHACYYPDRGDSLKSLVAEDQDQAMSPSCDTLGCAMGTQYLCCVPPSEVEEATYRVDAYSADIAQLTLFRADSEDHCTTLTISSALEPPVFPIDVPEGWSFYVGANGFRCAEAYNFPNRRLAIGGEGFLAFSTPDRCAVDFDFTLFFSVDSEVQATRFVGQGVAVPNIGVDCN